jgi:uncharacterized YigZ family protein
VEGYITIKKPSTFTFEDRKSIFIGQAMPVSSERDALTFIESVKKQYPDARHHVYAYILRENSIMRFTDDREPQGTAGKPILDMLVKSGVDDVCVVVTRYFGGTLLGTGGLVRAYTTSAADAITDAEPCTYRVMQAGRIICSYTDYQKLLTTLQYIAIDNTDFAGDITIDLHTPEEELENLLLKVVDITSGRAKTEKLRCFFGK